MNLQNILLEQPEPGIYLLTVNRPKALNALNAATFDRLAASACTIQAHALFGFTVFSAVQHGSCAAEQTIILGPGNVRRANRRLM